MKQNSRRMDEAEESPFSLKKLIQAWISTGLTCLMEILYLLDVKTHSLFKKLREY